MDVSRERYLDCFCVLELHSNEVRRVVVSAARRHIARDCVTALVNTPRDLIYFLCRISNSVDVPRTARHNGRTDYLDWGAVKRLNLTRERRNRDLVTY